MIILWLALIGTVARVVTRIVARTVALAVWLCLGLAISMMYLLCGERQLRVRFASAVERSLKTVTSLPLVKPTNQKMHSRIKTKHVKVTKVHSFCLHLRVAGCFRAFCAGISQHRVFCQPNDMEVAPQEPSLNSDPQPLQMQVEGRWSGVKGRVMFDTGAAALHFSRAC